MGLDRGAPRDGKSGLSESPAVSPKKVRREVAIIKNRPLFPTPILPLPILPLKRNRCRLLRHNRQRKIIPIAAFVIGLEGVVADGNS